MQKEVQLIEYLEGKVLKDLKFFSINENYFVKEEGHAYLIDGAVELQFEDENYFTAGLNDELEMFDYQIVKTEKLLESTAYESLSIHDFDIKPYLNQKIEKAHLLWGWYHEYDDDFVLKDEKEYMPMQLALIFENSQRLLLSSVRFKFIGDQIDHLSFDLQGLLLVANHFNFEIENTFVDEEKE